MPDFKGLFSDPEFYKLTDQEKQTVYQSLAADDPDMAQFTPAEHQVFRDEMIKSFGPESEPYKMTVHPTFVDGLMQPSPMTPEQQSVLGSIPSAAGGGPSLTGEPVGTVSVSPQSPLVGAPPLQQALEIGMSDLARSIADTEKLFSDVTGVHGGQAAQWKTMADAAEAYAAQLPEPEKDSFNDFVRNMPQSAFMGAVAAPLMAVPGLGVAGITAAGGMSGFVEGTMEAAGVYRQLLDSGESKDEALRIAAKDLGAQVAWLVASNAIQAGALGGLGKIGGKVLGKMLTAAGEHAGKRLVVEGAKVVGGGLGAWEINKYFEGAQEWFQEGINQAITGTGGLFENSEEQKEAFRIGKLISKYFGMAPAVGGTAIGLAEAPGQAVGGAIEAAKEKGAKSALEILASPEEAAKKGLISLRPERAIEENEARNRAAPDYLTSAEATRFVNKDYEGLAEEVATRPEVKKTPEQVLADLDAAEQKVTGLLTPQRMPAQPSQEGADVVTAIQDGIEQLAVQAESDGLPELAAARRERKGKVEVVEPRTLWERGLQGIAQLGSKPKLVFYTQPPAGANEPYHAGVFVRKGLVAVDVTDGKVAPKVILGTLLHEMTHNQEQMSPEAYQGAVDALRGTDLWTKSEADLRKDARATVNDKEIMAHIAELEGVATDVMYALANYTNVQDMAKAPSRVRALAEWMAKAFRAVVEKIGLGKNIEGAPLAVMEKIGALRADPEIKRNAARAVLALHDMLTAEGTVPNAVQGQEAQEAVTETPAPAVAEPTAQDAGQPQAPERLLAAEIGEEPVEIPYGEDGAKLTVQRAERGYVVKRYAKTGKVIASKPFPNLKAAKAYVNSVAGTKYSISFERLRQLEGPESPRSMVSAQAEWIRYRQIRDDEYTLLLTTAQGASETGDVTPNRRAELMKKAEEKADRWVRENLKVLEPKELSEAQAKFAEFARGLGIQINYYEGEREGLGGFSSLKGQVWIPVTSANNGTALSLPQIVAHEITHDLHERNLKGWHEVRDLIRDTMPKQWENAKRLVLSEQDTYPNYAEPEMADELENEIVAWVVHLNSDAFWNAVSARGLEKGAKAPFKAFYDWLVDLMVRINSRFSEVFRNDLYNVLGLKISAKDPADVVAMAWANAFHELAMPEGGAYSTLDWTGNIAIKTYLQDQSVKSPTMQRLSTEVNAPRVEPAPGEQLPLFSKRTGYPPAAQTPQQLAPWRERLRKAVWRGVQGQTWYEDSAAAILAMTGGNLEEARKFARVVAVYSPQQKVITNWHQAITAWLRYKVGYTKAEFLRENLGNRERHEQAAAIIYDNAPWSGEKTNSFFNNLFSLLDPTLPKTVTIDMWMMRLFGFSGDAPTDAQYKAMEKEMQRLATAMNVEPWQAQAMAWVYAKSVWEGMESDVKAEAARQDMTTHVPLVDKNGNVKVDDNGKAIMKQTPEYEALYRKMFQAEVKRDLKADTTKYPISAEALTTFATALRRRVAFLSMEAVPGDGTLAGLKHDADLATKIEYHRDIEEALRDTVGDVIAQVLGYGPIGDLDTMFLGVSAYYQDGRMQFNPARQMALPTAAERGAESTFKFDAASREMFKLYAVIRGMLTGQNSVAGYRRFDTAGKEADRNMAEILPGRAFTDVEVGQFSEAIGAALRARSEKLEGWEIALYPNPGGNGMGFMNLKQSGLTNLEFHALVREVAKQLGFKKKFDVKTFRADTIYVAREGEGVDLYEDVTAGREEQLREVESRVADKLASVYVKWAERGFGEAPRWAVDRVRQGQALGAAARSYSHFWHFSVEDVRETGIKREYAGTGAAGQERARFRYVDGKLDPESAVVHMYVNTGKAEYMVVTKANFINKVIADLKLIPTTAPVLKEILDSKGGDLMAMINALRSYGYDGIVDEERGMVQVNRDIDTSELVEGHELTPDERRAWKGAIKLEDLDGEQRYEGIVVPKNVELTQGDVAHVAASLRPDGTAWFPLGTREEMVAQHFGEVRSTSVGLVATQPRVASFSVRIGEETRPPVGREDVVEDSVAFGTQYSARSGSGWSLSHMDPWTQFVKWFQDSFIQFKRLHEIIQAHGMAVTENIDVRLAEERYHGKAQEMTRRLENKYIRPILAELRVLAKDKNLDYEKLLADFDDYLHAVHAPERNKYLQYVWFTKKLDDLQTKRTQLQDKIDIEKNALAAATSATEQDRIKNSIRFYEMKLVQIEQNIDKVKNQPVLDSGMSDGKARGILDQLRQDKLDKPFGRLAALYVYPMLNERLNNLLREGLISQQEYDAVNQYKHYVPLKGKAVEGDIDDLLNMYTGFTSSSGFDIRGAELPFVTGRQADSKINPILAQAVVDSLAAADRIERNRVAVALLDLVEAYPNDKLWEINKSVRKRIYDKRSGTVKDVEDWWARNQANVIGAKRGGETFYIYLKDRGLVEAMKGLGVENLWKWVHVLRTMMRTLAQLFTTFSPEFILTNFARDWQQALVTSTTDMGKKAALEVANESRKAVRGILAANFPDTLGFLKNDYTDAYHELKEEGGNIGFFGMRGVEDMQKAILDEMRSGYLVSTIRAGRRLGTWVATLNEATENGIRLATYVVARKNGASKAKAASLAKNVTVNFNRRGDIGGAIGVGWLFFNAGVQGIDRFWKSMQTPAGKKLAAFYIGLGYMSAMFARAAMGDDDDGEDRYNKISDFTKMRHWIIPNIFTDRRDDFFTVPLSYGFGFWAQVGKELEHMTATGQDRSEAVSEAAVRLLSGLTTHFSPLGETSFNKGWYAMSRPLIPTLIEPITDVLANETYWGGKIYPAKTSWDRRSISARHYAPKTASEKLLVAATEKLNHLTGGSEYRSGALDINANALSYVLDSYIGPTGQFMKRPFELAMKMKAGEDSLWNDWIILRRFVSETAPEYYVPGEYYDAVDDVQRAADEYDYLKKNGESEDIKRFMDRHGWKLGLEKQARTTAKTLKDLRNREDADSIEVRKRALDVQRAFVKRYLQSEKP